MRILLYFVLACTLTAKAQFIMLDADGNKVPPSVYCKNEPIKANLHIEFSDTTLRLTLLDDSGAAFARTRVGIFVVGSDRQDVPIILTTTAEGTVTFPKLKKGEYRFVITPMRAWQQPTIRCTETTCKVRPAVHALPTDQPYSSCDPNDSPLN